MGGRRSVFDEGGGGGGGRLRCCSMSDLCLISRVEVSD